MNLDKVWIVIPAYNVAPHLANLIARIEAYIPRKRIIIVDDGSRDGVASMACVIGAHLIQHSKNLGKGAALKTGFSYAMHNGAEWMVVLDGDGQHDPASLPDFFAQADKGEADLIIGRRGIRGTGMPWDRRFSNWTSSALLSLVIGKRLYDIQCGYRMIRASVLDGVECTSNGYDYEIELLLRLNRREVRFGWVEVPTIYSGESSSIHRTRDTLRFLKRILLYIIGRI